MGRKRIPENDIRCLYETMKKFPKLQGEVWKYYGIRIHDKSGLETKYCDRTLQTIRRFNGSPEAIYEYNLNKKRRKSDNDAVQEKMNIWDEPSAGPEELTPADLEAFEEDDSWDSTNPPPACETRKEPVVARKICPFLSDANIRHECSGECALSCAEHDYDDDGRVVKTYTKCAFKELIYELMRITHPMDVQFVKD